MSRRGRGGCGASPDWTAQGELLGKHLGGNTTSYVTDSLGRLQSVTLPTGHVVSYVYDGSNRRVGKKIDGVLQQGFLYRDAIKPAVELDGAGAVVSRFVYGSNPLVPDYVVRGGNTYRIFTDQIGSPRVVVDVSSGSIVERIDYDERGNTLNDTNAGFIPFGFAGGIVDRDTGLIRFGARDYDPATGRWTKQDPTRFGGGLNLYLYVASDPVNLIDPSATWAIVSVNGPNVSITIPIYFYGSGATSQNIQQIVSQIQNTWTGTFGSYNVVTNVRVFTKDPATSCPASPVPINRINLVTGSAAVTSNTASWGLAGDWDANSPYAGTYAHEASHLLGLPDQYVNPSDITYGTVPGRSGAASPSGSDVANAIGNRSSAGVDW